MNALCFKRPIDLVCLYKEKKTAYHFYVEKVCSSDWIQTTVQRAMNPAFKIWAMWFDSIWGYNRSHSCFSKWSFNTDFVHWYVLAFGTPFWPLCPSLHPLGSVYLPKFWKVWNFQVPNEVHVTAAAKVILCKLRGEQGNS